MQATKSPLYHIPTQLLKDMFVGPTMSLIGMLMALCPPAPNMQQYGPLSKSYF